MFNQDSAKRLDDKSPLQAVVIVKFLARISSTGPIFRQCQGNISLDNSIKLAITR